MQIEKKGSGPWATVKQSGTAITVSLGEDERSFNCADLQRDARLEIDIVTGFDGHLAEGIENGAAYVANIIIPPKRYAEVDLPMTLNEEPLPDGIDPACVIERPLTETVPVTLDEDGMESVRVILWTVNESPDFEEAI